MRVKLETVRAKRYITAAFVMSLTSFFSVPKGEDDIRMVYNGTESGSNDSIWVPRFILPTLETHLRAVDESTKPTTHGLVLVPPTDCAKNGISLFSNN
jgi:hypothetical protein